MKIGSPSSRERWGLTRLLNKQRAASRPIMLVHGAGSMLARIEPPPLRRRGGSGERTVRAPFDGWTDTNRRLETVSLVTPLTGELDGPGSTQPLRRREQIESGGT